MSLPDFSPERPVSAPELEECRFYHSFTYPDGTETEGGWDLRGKVDDYLGHQDVSGARVLDMGTASGFMTFEMEQRGAHVVSADVDTSARYTKVPYFDDLSVTDPELYFSRAEKALQTMKNSYWYSWHKYGSQAEVYYGDLLHLPESIGFFDIGFIGQIMVHNRDPLGILQAVAERVTDRVIISEGMDESENTVARFIPKPQKGIRPHGWLRMTTGLIKEFLVLMGFEVIYAGEQEYRCNVTDKNSRIYTIVGKRLPGTMRGNKLPPVPAYTHLRKS